MGRIIVGGILAGVVLFAWGFVSWELIGWHDGTIKPLPNESGVMRSLSGDVPAGVYLFPHYGNPDGYGALTDEERQAYMERMKAGPYGLLIYAPDGFDTEDPMLMVKGGVIHLLICLLAAWLLSAARGTVITFGGRVIFVTAIGLLAALVTHGMYWNWFRFPTDYTLVMVADSVVGWLLAGIVLASVIRPSFETPT